MFKYVAMLALSLSGVIYAASFQGLGYFPRENYPNSQAGQKKRCQESLINL
jgi:hypothetical protein